MPAKYGFELKFDTLRQIGLTEIADVDLEISKILKLVPGFSTISKVKEIVYDNSLNALKRHIESGGSSTFLDLDWLSATEISVLSQEVLQQREREIEEAPVIHLKNDRYDIRNLWVTAYGNKILHKLGSKLIADKSEFNKICAAVDDLGYELNIMESYGTTCLSDFERFLKRYSEGLREFIWWQAENR